MLYRGKGAGFTIVETLIFLIVSAGLFIIAATLFKGTQNRQQFNQSMRDVESKFQDIFNDVANGYFQNTAQISCTTGNPPTFAVNAAQTQGTSSGCVFLGKVIQLKPASGTRFIEFVPVAGNRQSGGKEIQTYDSATPTTVCCSPINLTERYELKWGATVKSVSGALPSKHAIGIFTTLGSYSGNNLNSGAQSLNRYDFDLAASTTQAALKACVEVQSPSNTTCPMPYTTPSSAPVEICFTSGGTDQTAKLTISGNGIISTNLEFTSC